MDNTAPTPVTLSHYLSTCVRPKQNFDGYNSAERALFQHLHENISSLKQLKKFFTWRLHDSCFSPVTERLRSYSHSRRNKKNFFTDGCNNAQTTLFERSHEIIVIHEKTKHFSPGDTNSALPSLSQHTDQNIVTLEQIKKNFASRG